jgi:hypothetical protein
MAAEIGEVRGAVRLTLSASVAESVCRNSPPSKQPPEPAGAAMRPSRPPASPALCRVAGGIGVCLSSAWDEAHCCASAGHASGVCHWREPVTSRATRQACIVPAWPLGPCPTGPQSHSQCHCHGLTEPVATARDCCSHTQAKQSKQKQKSRGKARQAARGGRTTD